MFNLYLEELRGKYKDFKFKKLPKEESGIQATIFKGTKTSKEGIKQTKFIKDYPFEDQGLALREIIAYNIIEYVNKAYKAFGFKTPAMPIPLEFDWEVTNNRIEFISSSFNKPKDNKNSDRIKGALIENKFIFVNALIGNDDAHHGNVIYKSLGKQYAIDFGYSLNDYETYNKTYIEIEAMLESITESENKKYITDIQKKLFFWINFIEKNKTNLYALINTTGNKVINQYSDKEIKIELKGIMQGLINPDFKENLSRLLKLYKFYYQQNEITLKEL